MKNLLLVISMVSLGFSACKKNQDILEAPVAAFSTNITVGQDPSEKDEIQLTNTSTDNSTYAWDFGNGTTSTEKNPTVAYKMHGTYTIKLSVTSLNGLTTTTTHDVIVLCKFKGGDHSNVEIL